jgi:iron only hydrogenase large subunit-like protein
MQQHFYHAHQIIQERCKARLECVRKCPTQAIRLYNGKLFYHNELCIDCGICINTCPEDVFVPLINELEDFSSFKHLIAVPSPVLYTQFGQNIHPNTVRQALKQIGFKEVVDLARISDEVSFALLHHLKTNSNVQPLISSFCPSIVRFIQVNYPNLVNLISPLDVPRELTAKEGKKTHAKKTNLKEEEIGVIYITPCPAKIVSIKQPAEKEQSWFDGAIPIKEIYNLILPLIIQIQEKKPEVEDEDFHFGTGWAVMGHIIRDVGAERCLSVAGLDNVKMILDDIENSKLRNIDFIEALACKQGCIGGAFCVENPYVARSNSILLEKKYGSAKSFDKEKVLLNYDRGYYTLEHPVLPRPLKSFAVNDIATSIKKTRQKERIYMKLPHKDCALCGAPTCEAFARDCANGDVDVTECIFFKKS